MKTVQLGRTKITVPQLGFGALPVQRAATSDAVRLLQKAYARGIRFFDTARAYTDSEAKLGLALEGVRPQVILATKTMCTDAAGARRDLETSLEMLRTDYIDLIQLHNPEAMPDPNDPQSAYSELALARREGLVRFIGMTNHREAIAREAVSSGLFDTLQFPVSHVSAERDLALIEHARAHGVGFIAMKALCGGLITNVPAAFAFFRRFDDVLPIWGIQHDHELEEFLELERDPPEFTSDLEAAVARDRKELAGSFCRGCGYCLPCPADIPIPMAARMAFLLRRAPYRQFLTSEWQERMHRIEDCAGCQSCATKCPYGLATPTLLREMLADYEQFARDHAQDVAE